MILISRVLMALTAAAAIAGVAILIVMMAALDRRGRKTSFWLARVRPDRYAAAYREAIRAETGRPGRLADIWQGLWIATLVLAALALLLRLLAVSP
jgi:hypothetical protein